MAQEFIPLAFPNKIQTQLLTGQMAVELVDLEDMCAVQDDGMGLVHGWES